jgi:hypothetical protein
MIDCRLIILSGFIRVSGKEVSKGKEGRMGEAAIYCEKGNKVVKAKT